MSKNDLEEKIFEEIKFAKKILSNVVHTTDLIYSRTFSEKTKGKIFLKMENLQKTGSFKIRGAYFKIFKLLHNAKKKGIIQDFKKKGIVAASAGNHAQGVALAAKLAGVKCKIVMPVWVTSSKYLATREYGGEIIFDNNDGKPIIDMDMAIKEAQRISNDESIDYIHPYDDIDIIAGQGTIGLEIIQQLKKRGIKPDIVIVPIGGGGLISGISLVLKKILGESVKVYGVESEKFNSMLQSRELQVSSEDIKSGIRFSMIRGATIADGIAVEVPGYLTHKIVNEKKYVDQIVLVNDDEISMTMFHLLERSKTLVEGAGATSLAAVLSNKINVKMKNTVAVLSGGNVTLRILPRIIIRELIHEKRFVIVKGTLRDSPAELNKVISKIASYGINIVDLNIKRNNPKIAPTDAEIEITLDILEKKSIKFIIKELKKISFNFKEIT